MWVRWWEGKPDSLPEEPLFCPHCGTTVSSLDLFCTRCGEKVEKGATSPGWRWYLGLAIIALALFLCILGIGVLGVLHGLEERARLGQKAALIYEREPTSFAAQLPHGDGGGSPLAVGKDCLGIVVVRGERLS